MNRVAAILVLTVSVLLTGCTTPDVKYSDLRPPTTATVSGNTILAPIIESLILVGVLELVRRARAPEAVQVLTAAFFVAEMHVWPWWPHATIVLASFCIQAASYLYWRRISWKTAFWVLVLIHALSNVIPALSAIAYGIRKI